MTKEFVRLWAEKAWELESWFAGTLSGGIDPVPHLLSCEVTGEDTAEISYDYPKTCGLSDVIYHVTDPHRVRKARFVFTEDGQILMDGKPFPGTDRLTDPWTADEANEFINEFRLSLAGEHNH